jgi:uncharacterized protein YchJ
MPTVIKKRTWCKQCQEFELFSSHLSSDVLLDENGKEIKRITKTECETCGTEYVPYSLSEVPEEKIEAQRGRYKRHKKEEFMRILNVYAKETQTNMLADMLREPGSELSDQRILEDDAGQIELDAQLKAEREAKRMAEIEFKERYRGVQRNEKCLCGSGLKYKKCCLPRVEAIR